MASPTTDTTDATDAPAKPRIGALYTVNAAKHYVDMLELSKQSLLKFHPDLPVKVVTLSAPTDIYERIRWFAGTRVERKLRKLFGSKGQAMESRNACLAERLAVLADPPFERTLFIDNDTVVVRPMDDLFDLAQNCDVVVQTPKSGRKYPPIGEHYPKEMPISNAGVYLFSKAFGQALAKAAADCPLDVTGLPDGDQFLFNQIVHGDSDLRVEFRDDLQEANSPITDRPALTSPEDAIADRDAGRKQTRVLHYTLRKRPWYTTLRKMFKAGKI